MTESTDTRSETQKIYGSRICVACKSPRPNRTFAPDPNGRHGLGDTCDLCRSAQPIPVEEVEEQEDFVAPVADVEPIPVDGDAPEDNAEPDEEAPPSSFNEGFTNAAEKLVFVRGLDGSMIPGRSKDNIVGVPEVKAYLKTQGETVEED